MNALLKLYFSLFILAPIFLNSQEQVTASTLGYKGPVKKVVTYHYNYTDLKNPEDEILQEFSPSGCITNVIESLYGMGICAYEINYNDLGYVISERCRKNCINYKNYTYKNDSILVKTDETMNTVTTISYDEDGQKSYELIEMHKMFFSPHTIEKYYQYKRGLLKTILSKRHTDSSITTKTTEYNYTPNGKISSLIVVDSSEKKIECQEKTEYNYDANGNEIKESYWINDTLQSEIFKLYTNNLLIEEKKVIYKSPNQQQSYITKYEYNEKGDVIFLKEESFQIKYQYEYDKYGNWILQLRNFKYNLTDYKEKGTWKSERKIKYYKIK